MVGGPKLPAPNQIAARVKLFENAVVVRQWQTEGSRDIGMSGAVRGHARPDTRWGATPDFIQIPVVVAKRQSAATGSSKKNIPEHIGRDTLTPIASRRAELAQPQLRSVSAVFGYVSVSAARIGSAEASP